jgi:hypothetical protein
MGPEFPKDRGQAGASSPSKADHDSGRVCEIALQSILKLDRADRQEEPAPDVDPSELPAEQPGIPSEDVPY